MMDFRSQFFISLTIMIDYSSFHVYLGILLPVTNTFNNYFNSDIYREKRTKTGITQ